MIDDKKMPHLPNPGPDSLANVNDFPEEPMQDIVSVNKKGSAGDNKMAKALFILIVGSVLVGALVYLSQKWLNERKAAMKASNAPKVATLDVDLFNPEKIGEALFCCQRKCMDTREIFLFKINGGLEIRVACFN